MKNRQPPAATGMATGRVKATGVRPVGGGGSSRFMVAALVALVVALAVVIGAAISRIGSLEETLRQVTLHKDHHRMAADTCLQLVEARKRDGAGVADGAASLPKATAAVRSPAPPVPSPATPVAVEPPPAPTPPPAPPPPAATGGIPRGPKSTSEAIFRRSFPNKDAGISGCASRPELDCTANSCIDVTLVQGYAGSNVDRCASICAAFDDCAFFWIYDTGGCCLKSSYDAAAALAAGGVRTGMPGDYYKLTARGPAPPPYVPPPIGQGNRNGDDYACSANSWAGRNPTDTTTKRPRTIRFKDKDSVASDSLPAMLAAIQATGHDGEERRYVDLGGGQHCTTPSKESLYDMGVLTHFSHALVKMDEIVDCSGTHTQLHTRFLPAIYREILVRPDG
jgi:hypothetical protein